MKPSECIIEEVARVMVQNPDLKAVTLDTEKHRISFALQGGAKIESKGSARNPTQVQDNLRGLVDTYAGPAIPACVRGEMEKDCQTCEHTGSVQLPRGIRMIPMPGSLLIEKETCATSPRFWKWRQFPGLTFKARSSSHDHDHDHGGHHHHHHEDWRTALAFAIGCGGMMGLGFILQWGQTGWIWPQLCFALAYLLGAWHPGQEVWELLRKRILDVHFLMIAVAVGAALINHWGEGAVLLFLFSLSGALEALAAERTEREISSLFKAAPKEAISIAQGEEKSVPVDRLQKGMLFRVKPGDQFAVDGVIIDGESAADESNLSGEAAPVEKRQGDHVLAGTVNLWGRIDCRVLRAANESALSKIIHLIEEAQASKAPSQRFTDHFGTQYTYGILGLSIMMFFVWWLGFGLRPFISEGAHHSAFYNTMTLLVVASPCALVLSIPSAILAGIASGARHGILFRGGAAIEKLAEINRVALDKTGTLTTGEMTLSSVESFPPDREEEVKQWAGALAQNSTHPVSRAIARAVPKEKAWELNGKFFSLTGQGLAGEHDGKEIKLGRRTLFAAEPWVKEIPEAPIGLTETLLQVGELKGRFLFKDQIREASQPLLQKLREQGIQVTMLTGDRPEAAQTVAEQMGGIDLKSGLKPEDKVHAIQDWTGQGEKVAMVGDGVNDAPSIAAAYVGVAMGLRGSDAALEQADVILMQDRLENFYYAYRLSQRARSIIRQNLAISLGVVLVLVLAALGSAIPLVAGVVGHEGSTVIVVLNSLRLLLPNRA